MKGVVAAANVSVKIYSEYIDPINRFIKGPLQTCFKTYKNTLLPPSFCTVKLKHHSKVTIRKHTSFLLMYDSLMSHLSDFLHLSL